MIRTLAGRIARLEQFSGRTELPKFIILCDSITAERRLHLCSGRAHRKRLAQRCGRSRCLKMKTAARPGGPASSMRT
jgi:hypothetical protein